MTQEELAEVSEVSVRTIRAIENQDRQAPRSSSIRQLCAALDIPADEEMRMFEQIYADGE
ncbi:XRE family transcriptional regulator [Pseudonocardiaceae bacterium YIM PH 21723]|nr:XRE family transcriptional regulator [Pseudonocardiaceae bacterium YIM PH 21723]